jgi:hypothetical protein
MVKSDHGLSPRVLYTRVADENGNHGQADFFKVNPKMATHRGVEHHRGRLHATSTRRNNILKVQSITKVEITKRAVITPTSRMGTPNMRLATRLKRPSVTPTSTAEFIRNKPTPVRAFTIGSRPRKKENEGGAAYCCSNSLSARYSLPILRAD